jgi:hypothetical protein
MMDLASRLERPTANESDAIDFTRPGFRRIIQLSTDGFAAYPEAVDLAFGPYAKFGTIVMDYRNATLPYHPSEMVRTQRRGVFGINEREASTICTSDVERNNLTIQTFMKRFTRLALGFSKKFENLEAAVNLHMAYYNFLPSRQQSGSAGDSKARGESCIAGQSRTHNALRIDRYWKPKPNVNAHGRSCRVG